MPNGLFDLIGQIFPPLKLAFEALPTGEANPAVLVTESTKLIAGTVKDLTAQLLGPKFAENIDTTGDPFAFIGSLQDVIVDEARLTKGPLSFADVLQYENRLSGIRTVIVIASFLFSLVVELVTLGQVEGFVGLLIHMVDDAVGDASKIMSTQLVRRAVGDPLESGFRRIHRHTALSSSDAEEAFSHGLISEEQLIDAFVDGSFKDSAIQAKVELAKVRRLNQLGLFPTRTKFVPTSVLERAFLNGIVTDEEFLGELARQGYDDKALSIFWGLAQRKIEAQPPPG